MMLILVGHSNLSTFVVLARVDLGDNTNLPVASHSIAVLNQDDVSLLNVSLFHMPL